MHAWPFSYGKSIRHSVNAKKQKNTKKKQKYSKGNLVEKNEHGENDIRGPNWNLPLRDGVWYSPDGIKRMPGFMVKGSPCPSARPHTS